MRKSKPERDCLHLCAAAAELLKRAGFRHVYTSMKTESCYYEFAGRPMLLRVTSPNRLAPSLVSMKLISGSPRLPRVIIAF